MNLNSRYIHRLIKHNTEDLSRIESKMQNELFKQTFSSERLTKLFNSRKETTSNFDACEYYHSHFKTYPELQRYTHIFLPTSVSENNIFMGHSFFVKNSDLTLHKSTTLDNLSKIDSNGNPSASLHMDTTIVDLAYKQFFQPHTMEDLSLIKQTPHDLFYAQHLPLTFSGTLKDLIIMQLVNFQILLKSKLLPQTSAQAFCQIYRIDPKDYAKVAKEYLPKVKETVNDFLHPPIVLH